MVFNTCLEAQDKDCKTLRTGSFRLESPDGNLYTITRMKDKQLEHTNSTGKLTEYQLQWTSDCNYILYNRRVLKGKDAYNVQIDTFFNVITEVQGDMHKVMTSTRQYDYKMESLVKRVPGRIKSDSLVVVKKNPAKGFYNDYLLFIPKGTPLNRTLYLIVEPNNTGQLSDSAELHMEHAIQLASTSSIGNNIATELHLPLLVPVFPRLASLPNTYSHALDRDVMLDSSTELKRLDLQLVAMISDARAVLSSMQIPVEEKIFMNGFSASATFTNRFSFMHPELIRALAIGGFNGELMFPLKQLNGTKLNYPLGTNDLEQIAGNSFNDTSYRAIPQFIFMGALDDNDAVQFDDAYSKAERKIINNQIGKDVQSRYKFCQKIYRDNKVNASFQTYEHVGHWTTGPINLEVIRFFETFLDK
jgi:hypothetical protein